MPWLMGAVAPVEQLAKAEDRHLVVALPSTALVILVQTSLTMVEEVQID